MKTHTLRNNKERTSRILTFTPAFEKKLLAAHPWATAVLMSTLLKELGASLDYEQRQRMQEAAMKIPQTSYQQSRALGWLQSGFRLLDDPLEVALDILDIAAHAMLPLPPAP